MPLPGRHLTSVLLRREGELFLFDSGEGTQVSLRALNLRWKKITAILISHTHADHVTGLPGMLMLSSQVEREDPLYVIGPPRVAEYVESSRRTLEMFINYEIRVREIADPSIPQEVFRGPDYAIRSFPLRHSRVCVGYTFVEDDRPGLFHPELALAAGVPRGPMWARLQAGDPVDGADGRSVQPSEVMGPARPGRKVAYVTDTLPIESIVDEVRGADVAIMEGMFTEEHRESAIAKKHMTAGDAGRLAAAAGVGRVGLIHYSPRFTKRQLTSLEDEAKAAFPAAFLTRDRMTIEIPYREE